MKLERPEQLRSEPPLDDLLRRLIAADQLPPARSRTGLGALAGILAKERRARDAYFNPSLFGEPSWEILLALRTDGDDGPCPALSALPISSPTSTAHRHVIKLQDAGLVDVWQEPTDMRRRRIGLTRAGVEAMQGYLAEIALSRALPDR